MRGAFSWAFLRNDPRLAPASVGACAYLLGFALPTQHDWPLMFLAAGALLCALPRPRWTAARPSRLLPVVVLFTVVQGITILLSTSPAHSATLAVTFLPAALIFVLLSEFCDQRSQIDAVLLSLTVLGIGLSVAVLAQIALDPSGTPPAWVFGTGSPIIVVRNDLIVLALIAPLAMAQAIRRPRSLDCALGLLCASLGFLVLTITLSRGGLLTFAITTLVLLLFLRPRLAGLVLVALLAGVAALDAAMGFALSARFATLGDPRLALWLSAWNIFVDAPLLGHGLHSFALLYGDYFARLDLPAWVSVDERFSPWAHNLYLEVLAEQGLLGIVALLALLGSGLALAWRLRSSPDRDTAVLASALFAALVGFCFAATFELTFIRLWVTVLLSVLLGLLALLARLDRQMGS